MKRGRARQAGLSLFELLLGLAICALVMAPLAGILNTSASAAAISGDRLALEREASFALERIAARVRATKPSVLAQYSDTSNSGGWFSPYSFVLEGSSLKEKSPSASRSLSDVVTAFSIVALPVAGGSSQLIQVTLTLARGADTATATSTLRMGGPR